MVAQKRSRVSDSDDDGDNDDDGDDNDFTGGGHVKKRKNLAEAAASSSGSDDEESMSQSSKSSTVGSDDSDDAADSDSSSSDDLADSEVQKSLLQYACDNMTENYMDYELREVELNNARRKHLNKKQEKPSSKSLPGLRTKWKESEAAFAAQKTKLLQLAKATRKQAAAQVSQALPTMSCHILS